MRKTWLTAIVGLATCLLVGVAFGADDGFKAPKQWATKGDGDLLTWAAMVVFVAGVGVTAFKNSKRTHLD